VLLFAPELSTPIKQPQILFGPGSVLILYLKLNAIWSSIESKLEVGVVWRDGIGGNKDHIFIWVHSALDMGDLEEELHRELRFVMLTKL
jgi:hypothetical protein